jgi:hypothetical protein
MLEIRYTRDNFLKGVINAIGFALPFQIFALPIGKNGADLANILGLLLVILATATVLWQGKFRRLEASEKAVLLCYGVACLSMVVAQLLFGSRPQLVKGTRMLIIFAFAILVFFSIRRYCNTPTAFIRAVTWTWRGLMVLAVLGLWQFLAINILHVKFLADWTWAVGLNPSLGLWRGEATIFGPIKRVSSFSCEPAHYCQFLLMGMGLAVFRLFPPPFLRGTAWKAYMPSRLAAVIFLIAYILSFSALGIIALGIVLICYNWFFPRISWKMILVSLLLGLAAIGLLNYISQGKLLRKFATMQMLLPGQEEKLTEESLTTIIMAINMKVTLASLMKEPLLGSGIGGHATAFEHYAPAWINSNPTLTGLRLNREDAGSLGLLFLSEQGLIGFAVLVYAFGLILWRAWRAVRAARDNPATWQILPLCSGLLFGGITEVVIYFLRMPMYYFISLWFLLALISVIPEVINQTANDSLK